MKKTIYKKEKKAIYSFRVIRNKLNIIIGIIAFTLMVGTIVFAACPPCNVQYGSWLSDSSRHWRTSYCTKCGRNSTNYFSHSFSSNWTQTQAPTCTQQGIERRWCGTCGYGQSRGTGYASHSWSGWKTDKNQHWKICGNCDAEGSRGNHVDSNIDGYCDTCNYLMAIPGSATISSAVSVKEGEAASFSINVTKGTAPITYQWYYNTTNSTSDGTIVPGETTTSLSINTTTKDMNGRYYYCAMSNRAGTTYSPTALLTVWYSFALGTQPADKEVNIANPTATFSVGIGSAGNPNTYNYQWYISNTADGNGSKIPNATNSSYSVTPTSNIHEEYYYCVVNNTYYTETTRRAKLVADITSPEITMGSFNQNIIINDEVTIEIPFTVSDTGEGYTENSSNFTAEDFIVKVGGVTNTSLSKKLDYISSSGNNHSYKLILSNITGDGTLSFEIPAGSIKDNFQNGNLIKTFSTAVIIDNTEPKISMQRVVSGINDIYANQEDAIVIRIAVTEAVGMNTNEFTPDDITVKVGGTQAGSILTKDLVYTERTGNDYIYTLTIKNVTGNGGLSIYIPADKMRDHANNPNLEIEFPILTGNNKEIIIDNIEPEIQSLITTLGGFNSGRDYPTSIESHHENWANEPIYVQINATDDKQIDYYMKSVGNNTSYTKIDSNTEPISASVNAVIYYKVVDMAGNSAEINKEIKLDVDNPNVPEMSLFEQRMNGVEYVFDPDKPSDKSIYIIPKLSSLIDLGPVQSGISKDIQYTYYTVTMYKDITKAQQIGDTSTFAWDQGFLLSETGYYEIQIVMTDIAGNQVINPKIYQVLVNKKAENTIRISNISDIGSGIEKVTIKIFESDDSGNQTDIEAIDEIVIYDPYKEIIKNVRLGKGKFFVEVTLEDKVGLVTTLKKTIVNNI